MTVTANWRPPTNNGGSPVTGYRVTAIRAGAANVVSGVIAPQAGANQTLVWTTLPAGNYRFTVVAINAVGTGPASAQSNQVVAR